MSEMGERLQNLRKARRMTIREVAARIGIAESTYRDWENGRSIQGEPYLELAKAFDVSLNQIFGVNQTDKSSLLVALGQIQQQTELVKSMIMWKQA